MNCNVTGNEVNIELNPKTPKKTTETMTDAISTTWTLSNEFKQLKHSGANSFHRISAGKFITTVFLSRNQNNQYLCLYSNSNPFMN